MRKIFRWKPCCSETKTYEGIVCIQLRLNIKIFFKINKQEKKEKHKKCLRQFKLNIMFLLEIQ